MPEPRPRVVFVDHVARLSGGELALLRLLPALRKHADLHVVLGEEGPLADRLAALDLGVEVLPLAPRLRDLRRGSVRPSALSPRTLASLSSYVVRLAHRLRELRPDVVHTNSLKAALYGGAAGRLARVPVVWHVRDRISNDYLPSSAVRLVRLASQLLPMAVVVNSHSTLATLPNLRHSRVVYNPIVPDAAEHGPERASVEHSGLTIGIVGRLAPWKGQLVFLEAFARAFRGTDARAHVVGSAMFGEDDYARVLESRARELGIAEQVDFRGFRADVWGELGLLHVLVHCSVTPEPFGQVVLEGMAAGLPVVATDAGGPAELITNEIDGVLVPPGDAPALTAVLQRLASDPALRDRLGTAARARSSEFTPERTARQLMDVYRGVLERAR